MQILEVIGIISSAIRAFDEDLPARNKEIARLGDGGIGTQPNNRCGLTASCCAHDECHSSALQPSGISKSRASGCVVGHDCGNDQKIEP
jgi:hypothetical protein